MDGVTLSLMVSRTESEFHRFFFLETEAQAELDLPFGKIGSETQRLARRNCAPVHVKRGEPRLKTENGAHYVVHTGIVRVIREVKSFCRELQIGFLAQVVLPAQAQVEVDVMGAKT